jgi:hypothetical protein
LPRAAALNSRSPAQAAQAHLLLLSSFDIPPQDSSSPPWSPLPPPRPRRRRRHRRRPSRRQPGQPRLRRPRRPSPSGCISLASRTRRSPTPTSASGLRASARSRRSTASDSMATVSPSSTLLERGRSSPACLAHSPAESSQTTECPLLPAFTFLPPFGPQAFLGRSPSSRSRRRRPRSPAAYHFSQARPGSRASSASVRLGRPSPTVSRSSAPASSARGTRMARRRRRPSSTRRRRARSAGWARVFMAWRRSGWSLSTPRVPLTRRCAPAVARLAVASSHVERAELTPPHTPSSS